MAITNPNDMAIDKNAFYAKYAQVAIEQQIKYGIPASITLAQMGFESTFGTSRLARESSNFFGVKQGGSWKEIGRGRVGKECASMCRSRWSPYH